SADARSRQTGSPVCHRRRGKGTLRAKSFDERDVVGKFTGRESARIGSGTCSVGRGPMNTRKRVKPRVPLEYRVLMTQKYDTHEKRDATFVGVRTVNEFQNFLYEIVVATEVSGRTVKIDIRGLRAPAVTIPGTGPARYSVSIPELQGVYTVVISKLDKEENEYEINASAGRVTVTRSPEDKFV